MDDIAHESVPLHSLPRKRKADSDDACDNSDIVCPSPAPSIHELATSPSKLPAPLSVQTNTSSLRWPPEDGPSANASPLSPSPSSSTSPTDPGSPSRTKRPRIDTCLTPTAAKSRKRSEPRRTQDVISALESLKGDWRWITYPSGETRLAASWPPGGHCRDAPILDELCPVTPTSPGSASPISSSSRIVIPIDPCSPYIPVRNPPINKDTLKELDLDAILRNPQLRHDFLFDSGLQFRAAASRRKREQADTYWKAVLTELESGCTCVTFDTHGKPSGCVCVCRRLPTPPADPIIACLPLRRRLTLRMPSRIKPLLQELLLVLLSIISPQTALVSTSPQSGKTSIQDRLKQQQEQAQSLRAVLDVDLIEQEMRHGLFDPSGAFDVIGQILKSHCAPMRDQAVDAMVQLAKTCAPGAGGSKADAVRAIRECFELLELMKLDIANHQMQTYRPYIIHMSPNFELRTFKERPNRGLAPVMITEQWLTSAHRRLADSDYKLALPDRPLPFMMLGKRSRVILSVIRGLVDLVFSPPSPVPLSSPVITTTSPSHQLVPNIVAQLPDYPETLFLDHSRLIQLTKDAADVTSVYLLLMLYRQLLVSSHQGAAPRRDVHIEDIDMQAIKKEILELAPRNVGRCFLRVRPSSDPQSSQAEAREFEKWRSGMQSVVLQVASRASEARQPPSTAPSSSNLGLRAPEPHLLKVAESWSDSHFKLESPLSSLMRDRLRDAVLDMVVQTVFIRGNSNPLASSPSGEQQPARKLATGMEPLSPEIRQLSERLSKLAVLHLNVYQTLYEQDDFSAGW
ncbi:T-complex protein 11-domain-containing protein [Gloeopeniophorella convolvens]|nr:T-complex protein 11-domain-containing protein [Gloeopeniophorella convolvens]